MPKLLHVTTVMETLYGFLHPFATHFRAQGWVVDGLANGVTRSHEHADAFDHVWEMPWSRLPIHPSNFFSAPARIREIVTREGYDIVHVHTPVAAWVTRMALRNMRMQGKPRVIYTAHGFHFYEGGPRLRGFLYRKLEQWAGRWTDYLVVMNREDEQAALRHGIVPPERLRFMPGIGVDTARYGGADITDADVQRVRQELGVGPSGKIILMIAEFIARKHHADAVHAMTQLKHQDACLAFAGVGPLTEDMKKLAERLGVANRVRFLGFRRDIPTLIKASAAMLLPSEQEGLPRSVMEAMCQGVPAIGTRIRGMTDLLEGGRGLLVPVGDSQAIADAMAWVLEHPADARIMGERGRDSMGAYDLRNIVALHEELYSDALGMAHRQAPVLATAQPSMA